MVSIWGARIIRAAQRTILGPGHCPGGPELSGTSRTSRTGTGTTLRSRACFDFSSDCVRWFVLSASKVVSFVPDVPGGSRAVVRDVRGSSRFVVRDVPGGCRLVVRDVPSCCQGLDSVIGQFLIFTSCISIYNSCSRTPIFSRYWVSRNWDPYFLETFVFRRFPHARLGFRW